MAGDTNAIPTRRRRRWLLLAGVLLVLILIILLAIGGSFFLSGPGSPQEAASAFAPAASVNFMPAVSYGQALQLVADLGLHLKNPCTGPGQDWHTAGSEAEFGVDRLLVVGPSDLGVPAWLRRLTNTPGVQQVYDLSHCSFSCGAGNSTAGVPQTVSVRQTGIYDRVTFVSDTSYQTALIALSDLGLRLAAPCTERALLRWWQPVGQEQSFNRTQTLTVATTLMSSTIWQQQIKEQPAVRSSQLLTTFAC